MSAMEKRRADFNEAHAKLAEEEPRKRKLKLGVGKEEYAFPCKLRFVRCKRRSRSFAGARRHAREVDLVDLP